MLRDDQITVRITSTLGYRVAYTLPPCGSIAIEPVSHANSAFNRAAQDLDDPGTLGAIRVQPAETFSCAMRIALKSSPQETPAP